MTNVCHSYLVPLQIINVQACVIVNESFLVHEWAFSNTKRNFVLKQTLLVVLSMRLIVI